MEERIIDLLRRNGPMIGSEIWEAIGGDGLTLWRTCRRSERLCTQSAATHYMRMDRNVTGYARVSPSIFREFLTYCVIGLEDDTDRIAARTRQVVSHMESVSRDKLNLAYRIAYSIQNRFEDEQSVYDMICFIIAGDIVYNMAHDVPRPERSTKKMVNGSDMDLVVVVDDEFPDDFMKRLDDAIYAEKYGLLMSPYLKEEIDYVVKKMERVREQVRFKSFKQMVACKILQEGTLLCGSERLFSAVKTLLRDTGLAEKIHDMEKQAEVYRKEAEKYLLHAEPHAFHSESLSFFYPVEESEEFE